jgi:DNA-directed RNA polymerase specialized sigma24 family protein
MAAPSDITPPSQDADLATMGEGQLLSTVEQLTANLDRLESAAAKLRVRRTRAFRHLRGLGVTRARIAAVAGVTEGGVGNLIRDLDKREAALPGS